MSEANMVNKFINIKTAKQLTKFGLVGILNTLVSLIIYYFLVFLNLNYIIANIIGYFLSSVMGYFLNKVWVFNAKRQKIISSSIRYYIVYGISLVINVSSMYLWVNILYISKIVAPVLTMFLTVPFNYIFNKIWTFNGR